MARPKKLSNYTSDQLIKLWQSTVAKEHQLKRDLLAQAKKTVKELERWFKSNKITKVSKIDSGTVRKYTKRKRKKRSFLKAEIRTYLSHGPQPMKSIVVKTGEKYGTVFQAVNYLVKAKLVAKPSKRGGAYSLVK